MIQNKIGGDFEIEPSLLINNKLEFKPKGYLFSSGRIALHVILGFLKNEKNINEILLPDYLCESIIKTAENNNLKISFYKLDHSFNPDKNCFPLSLTNKAILVINYFGLIDIHDTISFIKKNTRDCPIILDEVQALSEIYNESNADFTFASFRKFLPVPDGGWLVSNDERFTFDGSFKHANFYQEKLAGGILKYYAKSVQLEDHIYLKHFEEGEKMLDNYNDITTISEISEIILSNLEGKLDNYFKQRLINANFILEGLKRLEIPTLFPINIISGAPLVIPIILKNREIVRKKFFENKIFLPIHWPVPSTYRESLLTGKAVEKTELSIVVDHRYSPDDLQRILDILFYFAKKNIL